MKRYAPPASSTTAPVDGAVSLAIASTNNSVRIVPAPPLANVAICAVFEVAAWERQTDEQIAAFCLPPSGGMA